MGSVEFLRQANATGAILNHPNDGGYLEWARLPAPADLRRPADAVPVPGRGGLRGRPGVPGPGGAGGAGRGVPPRVPARRRRRSAARCRRGSGASPTTRPCSSTTRRPARERVARSPSWWRSTGSRRSIRSRCASRRAADRAQSLARAAAELARMNEIYPGAGRTRVFEGALALERGDTDARAAHRRRGDRAPPRPLGGLATARRRAARAAAQRGGGASLRGGARAPRPRDARTTQVFYLESRLWACYARARPTRRRVPRAAARARRPVRRERSATRSSRRWRAPRSTPVTTARRGRCSSSRSPRRRPRRPELRRTLEAQLRSLRRQSLSARLAIADRRVRGGHPGVHRAVEQELGQLGAARLPCCGSRARAARAPRRGRARAGARSSPGCACADRGPAAPRRCPTPCA